MMKIIRDGWQAEQGQGVGLGPTGVSRPTGTITIVPVLRLRVINLIQSDSQGQYDLRPVVRRTGMYCLTVPVE